MNLSINSKVKLNNGVEMPVFGLGTYNSSPGTEVINSVKWALEKGYLHIDTAKIYGNEKNVGTAVNKFIEETGTSRDDIFITTKLWISDFGVESAVKALDESLSRLEMDHVDLFLLHWPEPRKRIDAWKGLVKILDIGKAKAIGVSNFLIPHLEELLDETDIVPAVNQVEFSPFLYLKDLQSYSESKSIKMEAWSPLTKGKRFNNSTLIEVAGSYNKSPAQVMIRWGLQHGIIEIPKSSNKQRISENANIFDFEISEDDMGKLDLLNENYYSGAWNPTHNRWK